MAKRKQAAYLTTDLDARTARLEKAFERSQKEAKKLRKDLEKMAKSGSKALTSLKKVAISLGLASVFIKLKNAVIDTGKAMSKAASSAEEVQSKFETVTRGVTEQAEVWARDYADAVGRSTTELKGYVAALTDTFVPMGFARDNAVDLAKELTTLSVDLASFNNKADADVVRDLQSAIVGNTETVRKYGIVITQTALKQRALVEGMDPKNLTEQEKALLRLKMIVEGSGDAMGDASRTAGSFANQMKRTASGVKEFMEAAGKGINQQVVKALPPLQAGLKVAVDMFFNMEESISDSTVGLSGFGAVAAKVIGMAGDAAQGASFKLKRMAITSDALKLAYKTMTKEINHRESNREYEKIAQRRIALDKKMEMSFSTRLKIELMEMESAARIRKSETRIKKSRLEAEEKGRKDAAKGIVNHINVTRQAVLSGLGFELEVLREAQKKKLAELRSARDQHLITDAEYYKAAHQLDLEWRKVQNKGSDEAQREFVDGLKAKGQKELEEWQARKARLDQALADRLISQEQHQAAWDALNDEWNAKQREKDQLRQAEDERLLNEHYKRMIESGTLFQRAQAEGLLAQDRFNKMHWSQQSAFALHQMEQMLAGVKNTSRGMFEAWKVAALATAGVDLVAGTIKTWNAYPYPWNIPMTAAHVLTGVLQIQQLASQSFDSGTSSPTVPSGGGAEAAAAGGAGPGGAPADTGGGLASQELILQTQGRGDLVSVEDLQGLFAEAKERNIVFDSVRVRT